MKRWLGSGVALCWAAAAVCSPSSALAVEYVADMMQRGPQGVVSTGRLIVSGERRRIEVSRAGNSMVSIIDGARGVALTLFPGQKTYTEQQMPAPAGDAVLTPCTGIPGAECRQLGEEAVAGRVADKWEIRQRQQGMTLISHQWIDRERNIPLRQEMPGGRRSELRFVAMEELNGRRVEKWRMINTEANKAPVVTLQWYDPELGQAIKQELPGGYVSELDNIRVGDVEDDLFRAPADYRKMTPGDNP